MAHYRAKEYQTALELLNQILLDFYPPSLDLAEPVPEPLHPNEALSQNEPPLPLALDYGYRRYASRKCPPDIPRIWFLLALVHHQLSQTAAESSAHSAGIDHARQAQLWHAETARFTTDLLDSRFRALGSAPVPRWILDLSWERRLELLLLEREVRTTLPELVITPMAPEFAPAPPPPSLEPFFPESKSLLDKALPPTTPE